MIQLKTQVKQLWAIMLEQYDQHCGIGWDWQSVDGTMLKAPLGGTETGPNPTDRAKSGTKRHVLVDRRGAPLAVELAGANRPDLKLLAETLDRIVIERPTPSPEQPQHLCLDKGYDCRDCDTAVEQRGYIAHTRRKGEQPPVPSTVKHPRRRWVVERTHSWYNRFRKLLVRYEKNDANYLGLVDFASTLIIYRMICRLLAFPIPNRILGEALSSTLTIRNHSRAC